MVAAFLEETLRFHRFVAAAWLTALFAAFVPAHLAPAHAEKRVALVVGNDRYANLGASEQLQKAVNDAHAVGGALRSIGFDVIAGENLGRRALLGKLGELVQRLDAGDTALFFFSGHGVALEGVNYILPADVPDIAAGQETLLKGEAIGETYVISELTARGVRVAVIVLDACRTNPFSRPGGKGIGVAKGLAPPPQVTGVFSLYAARSGQAALDRLYEGDPSPTSVFSRVLVPMLTKPGVDLRDLAYEVREEVARIARTAGYDQQPEDHDGTIGGRVYLAGLPQGGEQAPRAPAVSDAERIWGTIKDTTSLAVLDDYIRQYGNAPIYGTLARKKRERLARVQGKESGTQPPSQAAMVEPPLRRDGTAPLTAQRERGLKPKETFRECEGCPAMVVVPSGSFTMGSSEGSDEGPQHTVTIGKPFAVGKLHVTRDEYAAFVNRAKYNKPRSCDWRSPGFAQEGSHPVVCVTWEDAKAYAAWVAKETGKPYRLLTEAEFEYAARGQTSPGTYTRFWFGNDESVLCQYANGGSCRHRGTSPAGQYRPNAFGLYDMAGNAWQWTEDCYHDSYRGAPVDGSAWTIGTCSGRVVRGGAWDYVPKALRAAYRVWNSDTDSVDGLGFRLARSLGF
jgi:formylglycine-generating enzyme required for sulfatase activity